MNKNPPAAMPLTPGTRALMTLTMVFMLASWGCSSKEQAPCTDGFERQGEFCEPVDDETANPDSASPTTPSDTDGEDPTDTSDSGMSPAEETSPCDGSINGSGIPTGSRTCEGNICTVAAGAFYMGSTFGHADECPGRLVTLDQFRIDRTEVTWSQYDECVAAGTCVEPPAYCRSWAEGLSRPTWYEEEPAVSTSIDDYPVTCIPWAQAKTFCAYKGGRLPSEAEWEKAARGTDGAAWPWGSQPPSCPFANFRFVSWYCEEGVVATGTYGNASAFGPVDMVGNAWEWVEDWYDAEWYQNAASTNPPGPTENCHTVVGGEPGECTLRIIRGGAYNVTEFNTRSAARSASEPERVDYNIGFRCVYDG